MIKNSMVRKMYGEYRKNRFTCPQNARRYQKPEKQVLVKHISTDGVTEIWWTLQGRGFPGAEPTATYREEIDSRYGY